MLHTFRTSSFTVALVCLAAACGGKSKGSATNPNDAAGQVRGPNALEGSIEGYIINVNSSVFSMVTVQDGNTTASALLVALSDNADFCGVITGNARAANADLLVL